ncbi:MAG: pyridoxal 5'-phosphate synthase [Woeseiaceae bacterium]
MSKPKYADRLPDELPGDPMHWADAWIKEATASAVQRNPNSMTVVTVDAGSNPSARVVLCKEFVPDPGYLVFYTNFNSRKVKEVEQCAKVAAVFHWDTLGRQIRIEGLAVRSPEAESDAYFATRDLGSQLGAWASDQSEVVESRKALKAQIEQRAARLGLSLSDDLHPLEDVEQPAIERPPHWGGIRIWASLIELWVEGRDRIHDRGEWKRDLVRTSEHEFSATPWVGTRLQP